MKYTETAKFISPILNLAPPVPLRGEYYEGTFLADVHQEKYAEWDSPYILLLFNNNLPEPLVTYLEGQPSFVERYSPLRGYTTFVFKMSDEDVKGVLNPFLEGKYSEIDRNYVNKFFPNIASHRLYGNRLVLTKSPAKRMYWENRIGVTLPEEAEVWPRPKKENEVYGYVKESSPDQGTSRFDHQVMAPDIGEMNPNDISNQDLLEIMG